MSQSRRWSAIESVTNILVGYGVAVAAQSALFPLFGIHGVSMQTNLALGVAFSVISFIRSYVLRRVFNGIRR